MLDVESRSRIIERYAVRSSRRLLVVKEDTGPHAGESRFGYVEYGNADGGCKRMGMGFNLPRASVTAVVEGFRADFPSAYRLPR